MQNWFFLIICVIATKLCSAQVTFEKNYYLDGVLGYNISPAAVNTIDSGYMLVSFSGDTGSIVTQNNLIISISRLNKKGGVLWNKNSTPFTEHHDYGLGEAVQYPDSSLVILWNDQNSIYTTGYIQVDKNGNTIWSKKYICPSDWTYMYMQSFTRTYDNGLIGFGDIEAYTSGLDFRFLLKTDSAGNILWCKQYYPDTAIFGNASLVSRIALTPDSGFLFCFDAADSITANGYGAIVKTDANGNVQWAKRYGSGGPEFTKPQIFNGSIILPFLYTTLTSIEVLKTNMLGIPIWGYAYTGSISNPMDGETDNNGNTVLSGLTSDTLGYMFEIDSSGNILWSYKYGKPDSTFLSNILFASDGGILGYGWGPPYDSVTPSQSILNLVKTDGYGQDGCEQPFPVNKAAVSLAWQDVGIKVYDLALTQKDTILNFYNAPIDTTTLCPVKSTVGVNNIVEKNVSVEVYPNPANTYLTIKTSIFGIEHLYLYDGLGNLVQSTELKDYFTTIPLTQLSAGIYYYRILDEKMAVIKTDNLLIIR